MSEKPVKRVGLIALGRRVTSVSRRALPTSNAGGNCQVTFENGDRMTGWKGADSYDLFSRLRPGDVIDFQFTAMKPGDYTATQSGRVVEYNEFLGAKVITMAETLSLDGIVLGQPMEMPEALKARKMVEEQAPRSQSEKISDKVAEEAPPASDDSAPDL